MKLSLRMPGSIEKSVHTKTPHLSLFPSTLELLLQPRNLEQAS